MTLSIKAKKVKLEVRLEKATASRPAMLRIRDPSNDLSFVDVELDPGALEAILYGKAMTGRATVASISAVLGKTKVVESRTVPYYGSLGDDHQLISTWVTENKQEPGWYVDPNVRPADIIMQGGLLYVTYHVFKFV